MQRERVIKWNRDRGLLETFDPDLEIRMLSEEAREFYYAETLAHKLAEYADFLFVLEGTKAKYGCNSGTNTDIFNAYKEFTELHSWARSLRNEMHSVLVDILTKTGFLNRYQDLIHLAYSTVCDCNDLKGLDKDSGKIKKSDNYKNPADIIKHKMGGGDIYASV